MKLDTKKLWLFVLLLLPSVLKAIDISDPLEFINLNARQVVEKLGNDFRKIETDKGYILEWGNGDSTLYAIFDKRFTCTGYGRTNRVKISDDIADAMLSPIQIRDPYSQSVIEIPFVKVSKFNLFSSKKKYTNKLGFKATRGKTYVEVIVDPKRNPFDMRW